MYLLKNCHSEQRELERYTKTILIPIKNKHLKEGGFPGIIAQRGRVIPQYAVLPERQRKAGKLISL